MKLKAFYKNVVLLVLLMMCGTTMRAQNLDSLERVAENGATDARINALEKLAMHYRDNNPPKAFLHARKYLNLAIREKNLSRQGKAYNIIGYAHFRQDASDSALFYYKRVLEIFEQTGEKNEIAAALYNLGIAELHMQRFNASIDNFLKALEYYKSVNDENNMADIYLGIAMVYKNKSTFNLKKLTEYSFKAIEIQHRMGDVAGEGITYYNLSTLDELDQELALQYGEKSLECFRKYGEPFYIAKALLATANTLSTLGNTGKAAAYLDEAGKIAESLDNENLKWSVTYSKAFYHYHSKDYPKAKIFAEELLKSSTTQFEKDDMLSALLLRISIAGGYTDDAFKYLDIENEKINNGNTKEWEVKLSEMEAKYETEKKELKISVLEKEKQLYIWLGIAGGATFLLTLAFLVVRQRLTRQKVARLEKEKQLVATQAVLDGETTERARLARDLHDGLGGMLSVVKLNLNDMKNGVSIESEDLVRFNRVVGLLDESIQELRRVAHNMMPDSLARYGLRVSLGDFCNSIPGAVFSHYGVDERLDSKLEVMIYRTVHELVNNALKHAVATEIIVQMIQDYDRVSITVQDDGRGFDPAAATSGTGLNNIRNRVGSYNGRMDVYSEPGKGTEINVEFKL